MKMPTAVARQSFPWKPGDNVSYAPGEGSLMSEDRLPSVTQTNGHVMGPSPTGSGDGALHGRRSSSGTAQTSESSADKRFPILGPTRHDTEVYFKARPTRNRSMAASRGLVKRSGDRVVPADIPNTHMAFSCISAAINAVASSISISRSQTSATAKKQRGEGKGHAATRSADFTRNRSGSDSLPRPEGSSRSENREKRSRTEIPIKFLSESGDIRPSDMTHRLLSQHHKERSGPRTILPSKHGFHRRSMSPTFKRLIAAAEKLQTVGSDCVSETLKKDKDCVTSGHVTSPTGVRLPSVMGDDGGGEKGGTRAESRNTNGENSQQFLLTGRYSQYRVSTHDNDKPSPGDNRLSTSPKHSHSQKKPPLTDRALPKKRTQSSDGLDSDPDREVILNGKGDITAWEDHADDTCSTGSDAMRISLNLPGTDYPTELHLFLPKLGDAMSEADSVSGAAVSERGRSRYTDSIVQTPATGLVRSRTMINLHQYTKGRPPQHPTNNTTLHNRHSNNHSQHHIHHQPHNNHHTTNSSPHQTSAQQLTPAGMAAERSGRSQNRRFTSPVRAPRRDRTPKPKAIVDYEPFIMGEHLREKLDDVPTLISLDMD